MRIFLFEWVTGGGLLEAEEPADSELLAEGAAMVGAVAEDLADAGHSVTLLVDSRVTLAQQDELQRKGVDFVSVQSTREAALAGDRLASSAEGVLVIAPESGGELLKYVERCEGTSASLLSPAAEFVGIASDKSRTAADLQGAGVPVAEGIDLEAGDPLPEKFVYPAVVKPCDGAGAVETWRVSSAREGNQLNTSGARRLERWVEGMPASVSILCGPAGKFPLPPTRQRVSKGAKIEYLGGDGPLTGALAERATRLAKRAIEAMPSIKGYVGVDLILGESEADDVVIEINPRLTVSYVGLRRMVDENLADSMVRAAVGEKIENPQARRHVAFLLDGSITVCEPLA